MASIEKKKSKKTGKVTYRAQVNKKGQRFTKTFSSMAQAATWAEEIEHRIDAGGQILKGKTLGQAFERYSKEISPIKRGKRWEQIRLNAFQNFEISSQQLSNLTLSDMQSWVDNRNRSNGTILREYQLIRSVLLKCLREWNWIGHNPLDGIRLPAKPKPRDRRITDSDLKAVLDALDFDGKAKPQGIKWEMGIAFQLAIETGMRHGEMWNLKWEHVSLTRRFCRLHFTKNGDDRDVALSSKAIELLKMMSPRKTGKIFKSNKHSASTIFSRKMKSAGIHDLNFHDSRHEAVTRLSKKLPIKALARMIGHRDLNSLMIYYNETAEEMAKLLD